MASWPETQHGSPKTREDYQVEYTVTQVQTLVSKHT